MWKALVAGVTMIVIAGSSPLYAQPRGPGAGGWPDRFGAGLSEEDANALADARIAAIRAALKLTPEQEKNWPPVEQALRGLAKQRYERMRARRDTQPPQDAVERMRRRAEEMVSMGTALTQLANATQPLYQSLNDAQKRRLSLVMRRSGRSFGHGMMGMMGRMMRGGRGFDDEWGPGRGPGMGPGRGFGPGMGPGGPGQRERL